MNRNRWGNLLARAVLTCALVPVATGVAWADKANLRVSAKPGAKLEYRLEAQNETNFAGMIITENRGGDVDVEVLESDTDDNPRFAFSFANFEASVMQGGNLMQQDPQLDGVVVHVTFSPRGEQLDLAPQTNLLQAQRQMVENLVDAFFAYLPEKEVEPDDSWVHKRLEESKTGDKEPSIDGELEYTFEDFEKKDGHECAKLFVQGAVKLNTPTQGGLFIGEAKTEGEMFVAVGSGHVLSSKLTTDISGTVGTQEVSRVQYLELKLRKE
jgi:hypothetical protein